MRHLTFHWPVNWWINNSRKIPDFLVKKKVSPTQNSSVMFFVFLASRWSQKRLVHKSSLTHWLPSTSLTCSRQHFPAMVSKSGQYSSLLRCDIYHSARQAGFIFPEKLKHCNFGILAWKHDDPLPNNGTNTNSRYIMPWQMQTTILNEPVLNSKLNFSSFYYFGYALIFG